MSNTLLQEARAALPDGSPEVSDDLAMKQLVHSQVLLAMDDTGLLDTVTFQGGSSITNCYDGIRLSEDLDFCVPAFPDQEQTAALSSRIIDRLSQRFGAEATVKTPKRVREAGGEAKVPVQRFSIKMPYVDNRPDIPWVYVKLELAQVDRSTSVPVEIAPLVRIGQLHDLMPIVLAEEPEEIIADKIISFTATTSWTRTRDLFDMYWLLTRKHTDADRTAELTDRKLGDYGLDRAQLLANLAAQRKALYGPHESAEALSGLKGMLVDGAWAQRISTPRGAMALVGKALDCCEEALTKGNQSV